MATMATAQVETSGVEENAEDQTQVGTTQEDAKADVEAEGAEV
jgi:hypothetical protein